MSRILVATFVFLAGCASPGVTLPEETLMLGEVMHVLSRDMVRAGEIAPGHKLADLNRVIANRGWTDAQIDQGRIVVVRTVIYWNNTISGIQHDALSPELLAEGLAAAPGNVVEFTVGVHGVVTRVRAADLVEGGCYYGELPVATTGEVLGALALTGPRGAASLYCAGIEREGWQRPRTYWHRLPGAVPESGTRPVTPPRDMASIVADQRAAMASKHAGFAVLIFMRPRDNGWAAAPIWVDGEKAAVLNSGTCDVALVSPGKHIVTAGSAESAGASSLLPGMAPLPKRELTIVVGAEERLVLEYTLDTRKLGDMFSALAAPFRAEKWSEEAFKFAMRPAEARDSCALDHEPVWRGQGAFPFPQGQP